MLTAVNCYLLWVLTWLQILTTFASFSSKGKSLWFYTEIGEPLGLSIPESFRFFSIALSVFAIAAVAGATWKTPRLWKRLFTVFLFAGIAVGLSYLNCHLRHYSFAKAVEARAMVFKSYHRNLTINYKSTDEGIMQSLTRQRKELDEYDAQLSKYRLKFPLEKEDVLSSANSAAGR